MKTFKTSFSFASELRNSYKINGKKFLLKAGADPTVAANNGCTALDLAMLIEDTDTDTIRLLAQETVSIAPPLMSFLPSSRPVSKLTRSISTPILLPKQSKSWWEKFSSMFRVSDKKVFIYAVKI